MIFVSKPKRNDPCPCGSGKKFKRCCGQDNVIAFNPSIYNRELERLHGELLEFSIINYEDELTSHTKGYVNDFLGECSEEDFEFYLAIVSAWIVFQEPMKNERTIFDDYYTTQKNKTMHSRTKKVFSTWGDVKPAIYEILSIDDQTISKITVQDVQTKENYELIFDEVSENSVGNLLIGLLLPFVQTHNFFSLMSEIPQARKEHIFSLLDELEAEDEELNDVFPAFVAQMINDDEDNDVLEWDDPYHEMVALLFTNHLLKKGFDEQATDAGTLFWHTYCQMNDPLVRKPESYAAALEYFIQQKIIEDRSVTQTQIAEEYGISAGTVSTNYRRLIREFDELDIPNLLDGSFEPSSMPLLPEDEMEPFNMEKEMRAIQKALEGEDFESEDEMTEFLNQALQDGNLPAVEESPRDIAQELLFEAGQKEGRERKGLIDKALDIYPNSPDAYLLLAENEINYKKRHDLLKKAVNVGETDLGSTFFKENKGYFWGLIETRPYMRAKASYAESFVQKGFLEAAVEEYEELLELNPNDNQGIRDLLLPLYIETELFDRVTDLFDAYEGDSSAAFMFNQALVSFLTEGMNNQAYELFKKANEQNPFVIDFLLKRKNVPNEIPRYIQMGGESEAIEYVQRNIHLWEDAEELLQEFK